MRTQLDSLLLARSAGGIRYPGGDGVEGGLEVVFQIGELAPTGSHEPAPKAELEGGASLKPRLAHVREVLILDVGRIRVVERVFGTSVI